MDGAGLDRRGEDIEENCSKKNCWEIVWHRRVGRACEKNTREGSRGAFPHWAKKEHQLYETGVLCLLRSTYGTIMNI